MVSCQIALEFTGSPNPAWGATVIRQYSADTEISLPKQSVSGDEGVPKTVILKPAYPNPFNPVTMIRFGLPRASQVALVVYDQLGREVGRVAEGVYQAGYHSANWDGSHLASGVYYARLHVSDENGRTMSTMVNKLLLMT